MRAHVDGCRATNILSSGRRPPAPVIRVSTEDTVILETAAGFRTYRFDGEVWRAVKQQQDPG